MATSLIREYASNKLKDSKAVSEVVCLAPVLENEDFRSLLKEFVDAIGHSGLLDIHALEGLAQIIQAAAPGCIDADDLVRILKFLNGSLQTTHSQSVDHKYRLALTISHGLDAMADGNVKGLERVNLHEALSYHLKVLKKSDDPYLVFQAAYAFQALLYVPDDETLWHTTMRRTRIVFQGVAGLASAVKAFDVNGLIEGLENIQNGLGVVKIFELVESAYKGVAELTKSGQGLHKALKAAFSLSHKNTLLQNGELTKFKTLVYGAPCRRELAFQWGVCQRLGNLAADPLWGMDSRQSAVAFLGEIHRNDAVWGQEAQVKQCIINILMQVASESGSCMPAAQDMLEELERDGDATKRALYRACRDQGLSSHPWKVTLPLLESSALLDSIQNKPEVETSLRKMQQQRLEGRGDALYIPPQAKANRRAPDTELFDLKSKVDEFLSSGLMVLLLLGDSGVGKSTFNRELECHLWDVYKKHEGRIPVFITLPAIDKPEEELVAKQLIKAGFTKAQIRELKAYREIVLICDGYDECQLTRNLYNSNQLNQPGEWKAKMVISCRSEHLSFDYCYRFQPGDRNDWTGAALLEEAVIVPFSERQIRCYIEKYVAKEKSSWKVENYAQVIGQIPSLQELVKNPFLLALSLKVLPEMIDLGQNLASTKFTRVELYDRFVEQWVERGKKRLTDKELIGDEKKAFNKLSDENFSQTALSFVKKLAVAIFNNQGGNPVVEYPPSDDTPSDDKDSWKQDFFQQDDRKNLLREVCPLNRNGNLHKFIHRSVLEYGLARAVFEPRSGGKDGRTGVDPTTTARRRASLSSVSSFEDSQLKQELSVATNPLPDINSPLVQNSFVAEPSILLFLAERVQQEPVFRQQLLNFIEHSKMDKKWRKAAGNAITILVKAGIRFNGADLQGIRIPGADLNGGEFDNAKLADADLRNVNLHNTWLRQANLSNAQMAGVQFGERPYLEEESLVLSCAYSPDGKSYAVRLANDTISVYDTTTW
ncbi:hypothetical protein BGZ58_005769, partial [Dissophora ornata]